MIKELREHSNVSKMKDELTKLLDEIQTEEDEAKREKKTKGVLEILGFEDDESEIKPNG